MKPTIKIATTLTPDGGVMELYQHDGDFSIRVNSHELMNSRQYESEQELARLGCAHLRMKKAACILIGGLGLGYTLRKALELLPLDARVIVSELLPAVVQWNREYLQKLNGQALEDKRTELITGDIFELLSNTIDRFDAILLDIDNGPHAMTDSRNQRLYTMEGIQACRRVLRKHGSLAVWSTDPIKAFEQLLLGTGLHVRRYQARAYQGGQTRPLVIWVASEKGKMLPPGGELCR